MKESTLITVVLLVIQMSSTYSTQENNKQYVLVNKPIYETNYYPRSIIVYLGEYLWCQITIINIVLMVMVAVIEFW